MLSPEPFALDLPESVLTTADTKAYTNGTAYVRGQDGKMHPETAANWQQTWTREKARFDRQLNLLAARGALARHALTKALNAAAADSWEVAQVAAWGGKNSLVYLLRRRP